MHREKTNKQTTDWNYICIYKFPGTPHSPKSDGRFKSMTAAVCFRDTKLFWKEQVQVLLLKSILSITDDCPTIRQNSGLSSPEMPKFTKEMSLSLK